MKKLKHIYKPSAALLFLTAMLVFLVFCSCTPASEGGSQTSGVDVVSDTESAPVPSDYEVVKDRMSEFQIIRTDAGYEYEAKAAREFRDSLEAKTGCRLVMNVDWYIKAEPAAQYEILVGHTEREESQAVNAEVDSEDGFFYVIRGVGDKIVVTGKSPSMISKGLNHLLENYVDESGNLIIPRGINIRSENFDPMPGDYIAAGGEVKIAETQMGVIIPYHGCRIIQGGGTDGQYLYVILNDGAKSGARSVLNKISLETMRIVDRKVDLEVDDGNDLCVNPKTGELIIVHNAPNRTHISVFDAETLEFKRKVYLNCDIFAMSYDEDLDCYWVGLSGGDNFAKLDSDFKIVRRFSGAGKGYTTQGMDCDSQYLYFVMYNKCCIVVYDKKGSYIGEYELPVNNCEPENISHVGDEFYIVYNNSSWTGGVIYKAVLSN